MRTEKNNRKRLVGLLAVLLFSTLSIQKVQAQEISVIMEISWQVYGINYHGLMVTYTDNTGDFIVDTYLPNIGYVRIFQDIRVNIQCDGWGNCTTFLYGYNAVSDPPVAYSPDNFVIYQDGSMFTQDDSGTWSTAISARIVPTIQWKSTLRKYGLL